MRVSLEWLKELVPIGLPVEKLTERLDMTGTKVEAVLVVGESLDGVVVGQVITKHPHPQADKLWVTTVDIGAPRHLDIVCGASNFEAGDKVAVATVGAILPGGQVIKRAKLRGVVSEGMMASARELATGSDASGLLILPPDAPVGTAFSEYQGMADTVLDLEITPNRPDCLCVAGVAREVGAVLDERSAWPARIPPESGIPASELVTVTIDDPALCPRYTVRVIKGVEIGPSPAWLVRRLAASGARPINNVVDATNYVMFLLGQPLHAFDADTLAVDDGRIAIGVRAAAAGERLTTLDGRERTLTEDMIVIVDPSGSVALAGVMGGEQTEVSDATVDVVLESACFDPSSVSRTSRGLKLVSEASSRFEKGVDADGCAAAADYAAALIAELAGGTVAPGIVDAYPAPASARTLPLHVERTNRLLGTDMPAGEMAGILSRLGLTVPADDDELTVTVPTWRPDLEREIDLVEEVVRLHGMENVTSTLPAGRGRVGGLSPEQAVKRTIGAALRAAGLSETIGLSFSDPEDLSRLEWPLEAERAVELVNPISEEQALMRVTLVDRLLHQVADNQRHGVPDVHFYEIAATFLAAEGRKQPKERWRVAGALAGSWQRPSWAEPAQDLGFFDGKGVVTTLMEALGIERWRVGALDHPTLQSGRAASVLVGGETIGWVGEIAPGVLEAFEASGPVTMFELDVDALVRASLAAERSYREIPRFPGVLRDIALVVDEEVTTERVDQAIRSAGGKLLDSARLFDVYRGAGIDEGRKSLAYALVYRAADRTLTDEEVGAVHERLVRKVAGAVGGALRA